MAQDHELFTSYNWITFIAGMLEMSSTQYYGEAYPLLETYCKKFGINDTVYIRFIQKGVEEEGLTYQECLDDIITMMLDGNRYILQGFTIVCPVIQFCLDHGCTFPQERIFERRYKEEEDASLEDEIVDYEVRAKLIDHFHKYIKCKCADWEFIEACYWEDFYFEEENEDYDNQENSDYNRYRHLKSLSKHLLETYPNSNDKPY